MIMKNKKNKIMILSAAVFIIAAVAIIIYVIINLSPVTPEDVDFVKMNINSLVNSGQTDFNADITSEQSISEIIEVEKHVKKAPPPNRFIFATTWKIRFEYHMKNGWVKTRKYTGQIEIDEISFMLASIPEIAEKIQMYELKGYFGDSYERPEK